MSKKITILGTNVLKLQSGNAIANRSEYICANNDIVNGAIAPANLTECFERFPNIKLIADVIGVSAGYMFPSGSGISGNTSGICPCTVAGLSGSSGSMLLGFSSATKEVQKVIEYLGKDWTGCFWSDPYAIFSSGCPDVGPMYDTYLKYRLGSATFWNTPVNAPVKRQQFVESVKDLVEITVAGNLSQRPGDIVYIKVDNATGLITDNPDDLPLTNIKSGYYYILRVRNVIKNDGGHTTILSLGTFLQSRFYPPYESVAPFASQV